MNPTRPPIKEEEPFQIDPGSEDPGAGIDQPLPEPGPQPPTVEEPGKVDPPVPLSVSYRD